MLKQILIPFLALLAGRAAAEIKIVATLPELAAIAREVGGNRASVISLAKPGEDPHFVDAKPSFMVELNRADVLVEGGADLEAGWLPPVLNGARNPKLAKGKPGRIDASEGVAMREKPAGALSRDMGDVHAAGDPHYFLDPVIAKTIAGTIARRLAEIDPAGAGVFQSNAKAFAAKLDAELQQWRRALAPAKGAKFISYHKSYGYFAERFGLVLAGTLEPKPGIAPSPAHLAEVIEIIRSEGVRFILQEPNRPRKHGQRIAEETGTKLVVAAAGIPPGGALDYIEAIDRLVEAVAGAVTP